MQDAFYGVNTQSVIQSWFSSVYIGTQDYVLIIFEFVLW